MEEAWRWFVSAFAIAMCVVVGLYLHWRYTPVATTSFIQLAYICPLIFYLGLVFGYQRARVDSAASGRWLNFLLLVSLVESLALWSAEWGASALARAAFWAFLAVVLVVGFRGLAIGDGVSSRPPAWFRRLSAIPGVLLVAGTALVLSSLFLQVTFSDDHGSGGPPMPTGWRLLLRQARWITAEVGLTRHPIDQFVTGIPAVIFDAAGYGLYAVAILASLVALVWLARLRFSSTSMVSSRVLPIAGAATMLSALWAVTDIYWGWQFELDKVRWAAWAGFACWAATLGFGLAAVLQIARGQGDNMNVRNLMLFQVPIALFNFFMVPEYLHDSLGHGLNILPLAGLGLLLVGLQMQSWAYAAMLLTRGKAHRLQPPPSHGPAAFEENSRHARAAR